MTRWQPRDTELSVREVDGELMLLDERTWTYLHLNASGAVLWNAMAGGATEDQLVDALCDEFAVDREVARGDARDLLQSLADKDLVTEG